MKKFLTFILFLSLATSYAQETTFILIRHAEKTNDGTKDPTLTAEGETRANNLLKMFEKADITAVYSTNYKRTQLTVAPLAKAKGLEIKNYDWKNPKALLNKILETNNGETVLICGHSNTTPILANLLTGKDTFTTFEDSDYGNLLIIAATKVGAGKLLHMRY